MVFQPVIIIYTFLAAAILLSLFYLTGWILSFCWGNRSGPFSRNSNSYEIFTRIVAGMSLLLSVYALLVTRGNSSLLPVSLLSIFLVRSKQTPKQFKVSTEPFRKRILLFFGLSLFLYGLYMLLHFISFDGSTINFIGGDTAFYARAGEWLNQGRENVTPDPLGLTGIAKESYHYGDTWAIAFLEKLTGIHPIIVTSLVLYPVCISIFLFGLWTYISSRLQANSRLAFYLVLFAGFVSGFAILLSPVFDQNHAYSIPILYFGKLSFASIFIIGIILFVHAQDWHRIILLLALSCILYIPIAPALVVAVFFIFFYFILSNKRIAWESLLFNCLLFLIAIGYYVYFYRVESISDLISTNISLDLAFNILAGGILQLLPLAPFILLLVLTPLKNQVFENSKWISPDFMMMIVLLLTSIVCWSVLYWLTPESVQFFSNIFIPVQAIFIVVVTMHSQSVNSKTIRGLGLALYLLSIIPNCRWSHDIESVAASDFAATRKFLDLHGKAIFVNLRDTSELKGFSRNTIVYRPLEFIYYIQRPYTNISLNTSQLVADSTSIYGLTEIYMLERSPFTRYTRQKASAQSFEEYAYLFIREFNVRYVTISPNAQLPQNLRSLMNDSLLLSGGWRIYSVRPGPTGK